jgi:RNA polymerase sigma-70 factor (ECF subfamily)
MRVWDDFDVTLSFRAFSVVPMEAALERAWEKGRAAWPNVELARGAFAAHVLSKVGPTAAPQDVERLDAEGLYLACACAQGLGSALAELDRHVLAKVPEFLARIQGSSALPDEVRQTLRERLLVASAPGEPPRIATYSGEGPLAAWVRVAAVRTALNLLEKKDEQLGHDSRVVGAASTAATPEQDVSASRQHAMFREVLEQAVSALPAQQRTALRLHFAEGLTGDEIGRRLGISRATVTRWLATARTFLLRETRRLLEGRLRLSPAEAESFIASARSRLDLSLSVLLSSESR